MAAYAKSTATTAVVDMPTSKAGNNAKTVDAEGVAPPRLVRLFALYEYLAGFMVELCSSLHDRQYPETPITQSNNIVDISGVGLKQFWNLRSHMQDASVLATAHYPETLDRIFVRQLPLSLLPLSPPPFARVLIWYLIIIDCWCTIFLSHRLELDQTLVRPDHRVQDLHSGAQ